MAVLVKPLCNEVRLRGLDEDRRSWDLPVISLTTRARNIFFFASVWRRTEPCSPWRRFQRLLVALTFLLQMFLTTIIFCYGSYLVFCEQLPNSELVGFASHFHLPLARAHAHCLHKNSIEENWKNHKNNYSIANLFYYSSILFVSTILQQRQRNKKAAIWLLDEDRVNFGKLGRQQPASWYLQI